MNKKIVIIGASGHGKVIADIARLNGYEEILFLDDDTSKKSCGRYPVVGTSKDIRQYKDDHDFIIAIGNNRIREKISDMLERENIKQTPLIHPSAVIDETAIIKEGTVIMANAVVNAEVQIGRSCIINTASSIDHECILEDYVHVSPGVHVAGTVTIGKSTWIGIGATVINNLSICANCMIGAGSTVIKDIKEEIKELIVQEKENKAEQRAIRKEYDQIQKELPKLHKKELRFQELQKQIKQYKELEALEKKKESLKNAKERMIRQQEETEKKKENERQRELKLLEFLRQADEIETQYDHLQKEELKLHVQTEKNHELCKEKEAYFEKLRIYEEAGEVYDKIRMQRKEYRDRLSDWQDRYDCNQAGLLARNLIDGHPCPVCGSLHHPKTADFKESDITQEMLRALREETELIDRQYNTAFAKVKQSKGIVEICKEQLCKKSGKRSEEFEKLDEIYEISLRQYKKVKKEFERIKKQKEKIAEQRVKVEKSKEKQLNYVEKLQEIAGKSHEKDSLYKQTEARIEEICKNLEYKTYKDASEEQQRLSDEIDQMKFNKEEIEKKKESVEIQGVHVKAAIEEKENTLSSVTKQLEEHKEMNEEISDFRKFETKLHQMKKEIQKQNQNLEQLNQHISVNEQSIRFMDKKMEEYKETEMNYTLLKDLSDTANGEQKGKTKISFERFVQSVYFDLILAAANERLSVMSEQRYYLLRKEENDINKGSSGLELEILDEWTGKRRNVRSLSGGESFKAALSLALGLSDVIQNKKGGIQVDTIFIDEGFGTLDADSLNKAMQIINSLSLEGNKLVGIISHVDELKDQIDQKIEVYKDHAGSKVK